MTGLRRLQWILQPYGMDPMSTVRDTTVCHPEHSEG